AKRGHRSIELFNKCAVGDAQAKFIRMKSASKKRTPSIVNLTVKRRYLTEREVERLMDCARFRFSRALPPGASRSRRDERHSIRWTLGAGPLNLPRPGRTTYLPRPRRRRLRCRRPRKGGRHAVRCSGLRQTWPP